MKLKSILKLAFTNLKRRKLRSFLTILGISIGIGMLFFLLSVADSLKKQMTSSIVNLSDLTLIRVNEKVVQSKSSFDQLSSTSSVKQATASITKNKHLTEKTFEDFKKIPHLRAAYPNINLPLNLEIVVKNKKVATSSVVTLQSRIAEEKTALSQEYNSSEDFMEKGTFFTSNGNLEIVASHKLATQLQLKSGERVIIELRTVPSAEFDPKAQAEKPKLIGTLDVKVIGIAKDLPYANDPSYEGSSSPSAFASFALAKMISDISPPDTTSSPEYRLKKGEYSSALIFVDDFKNVRGVEKEIKNQGYETFSIISLIDSINSMFLVVQLILAAFSLVAISIALIGISNTMYMSGLERTREIGILKALGAREKDISRLFMAESGVIGFTGALMGIIFATLIGNIVAIIANMFILSQLAKDGATAGVIASNRVYYSIDPVMLVVVISFAVIVAILAGFLPARQASKLDPIKALKYE